MNKSTVKSRFFQLKIQKDNPADPSMVSWQFKYPAVIPSSISVEWRDGGSGQSPECPTEENTLLSVIGEERSNIAQVHAYLSDCLILLGQVMADMDAVVKERTPVPPIKHPQSINPRLLDFQQRGIIPIKTHPEA